MHNLSGPVANPARYDEARCRGSPLAHVFYVGVARPDAAVIDKLFLDAVLTVSISLMINCP